MTKLAWVKWEPAAFLNGVVLLDAVQIGVYTIILNLIYDSGGPIPDNAAQIGRRCGLRPTSCEKVLHALAEAGKITRDFGVIDNARAASELKTRTKVVEKWKKNFYGGEEKLPKKVNENKDCLLPLGSPSAPPNWAVDKESVKKERKKERKDSSADALSKYEFEDGIIRLNKKDFAKWEAAYPNLNLRAELMSLSKWAEDQGKNWFHAVKGALTKRHRSIRGEMGAAMQPGYGDEWG